MHASVIPACTGGRVQAHPLTAYRASLVQVVKEQLDQPMFQDGLQGVLELAKSVSLTDTLLAADLDIAAEGTSLAGSADVQTVSSVLSSETVSLSWSSIWCAEYWHITLSGVKC